MTAVRLPAILHAPKPSSVMGSALGPFIPNGVHLLIHLACTLWRTTADEAIAILNVLIVILKPGSKDQRLPLNRFADHLRNIKRWRFRKLFAEIVSDKSCHDNGHSI